MAAAPFPADEAQRLAALHEHCILDTPPSQAFDDLVRLASFVCGTPIAAVSLVDADRQWFKAIVGADVTQTPREVAFCAHTILQDDILIIQNAAQDERFADNPLVTGDPNLRFYAGMPLIAESGHALGALCVLDCVPRTLSSAQQDALKLLAGQAANNLTLTRRVAEQQQLIAERRQAQEQQQQAQKRFHALAESLGVGLMMTDLGDKVEYINPRMTQITGYTPEELVGRRAMDLLLSPSQREAMHAINRERARGQGDTYEITITPKDAPARWMEVHGVPFRDEAGTVVGTLATCIDVTDRVSAQAALHQKEARLVEAQHLGGIGDWELDLATQRFTWSEEVFRLMEFDPAQGEPSYADVQARYHPTDKAERDRVFTLALATGGTFQCDLRLRLPSGIARGCHLIGRAVRDADGRVVRMVGTALDITERMERERQVCDANLVLETQKAQLQAANAELAALATTDPLTGLLNHRAFQARLAQEAACTRVRQTPAAVAVIDLNDFHFFNDVHGSGAGDQVLRRVAAKLEEMCGPADAVARFGGDEFWLLLSQTAEAATPGALEARLRAGLSGLCHQLPGSAAAIPVTVSVGAALLPCRAGSRTADSQEAVAAAGERLHRAKTGGEVETEADRVRAQAGRSLDGFSMLDALVTAVDNKDRYTRKHSEDVLDYSLQIARALGLSAEEQRVVAVAALLHDVGKIGVPDAILRKPGPLTEAEFAAVRQHPMMGAVMVAVVPRLENMLDAVRHHHERWDGKGYPFGLTGEETPLIARLMAVADAFSAMTTDRPYRKGMDAEKALAILADGAGTQWDPRCVQAFLTSRQSVRSAPLDRPSVRPDPFADCMPSLGSAPRRPPESSAPACAA